MNGEAHNMSENNKKRLLLASPSAGNDCVIVTFIRLKFDINENGILEDVVAAIQLESLKVLGVWYADMCPFHIEGITP